MPTKLALIGLFLGLSLTVPTICQCQTETIVWEDPVSVQSLSGLVQLGASPEGVKGVLVEDCTRDWKIVKASTHTDENGRFSFPGASAKHMHYLRFSLPATHTVLMKVRIEPSGQKELSLVLSVCT